MTPQKSSPERELTAFNRYRKYKYFICRSYFSILLNFMNLLLLLNKYIYIYQALALAS